MIEFLQTFLSGKLTYIVGLGLVGMGIYQIWQGDTDTGTKTLLTGLGFCGVRRAIGEVPEKINAEISEKPCEPVPNNQPDTSNVNDWSNPNEIKDNRG